MTDREKPAGARDADGLYDLPARTEQELIEDRALADRRKHDRDIHEDDIGAALTELGDPERDDDHRRAHRQFLVRILTERLDKIAVIPPPPGASEYRLAFMFGGDVDFTPLYIGADLITSGLRCARLRRLNECPIVYYPPWTDEVGA